MRTDQAPLTDTPVPAGRTVAVWAFVVLTAAGLLIETLLALGMYVGEGMRCDHSTLTCDYTRTSIMTVFLAVTGAAGLGLAFAGLVRRRTPGAAWLGGLGFAGQYVCFFTVVAILFRVFG